MRDGAGGLWPSVENRARPLLQAVDSALRHKRRHRLAGQPGRCRVRSERAARGEQAWPSTLDKRRPETPPPIDPPTPTAFLLEHPSLVEFGPVTIGNLPVQQPLRFDGPEQVPLSFTVSDNPDEVFAVEPACEWTEATGAPHGCTVFVTFTPRRETDYLGTVSVIAGDESEPRTVQLTGLGVPLFLRFPTEITFDNATIGDSPAVASLELFASDDVPVDFAVVDGVVDAFEPLTPCVWVVGPSGLFECSVDLQFTPLFDDEHSATLQIITNEPEAEPRLVRLVGRCFFRVD